jgi:hypothetical protein
VRFVRAEDDPAADAVFRKVKDGIIQNVSVGYRIHKLERVGDGDGQTPVMRATDWEPFEVSCVAMDADDGAGFHSTEARATNRCTFITHEKRNMENENQQTETRTESPEVIAERERASGIRQIVRRARLGHDPADDLVARGVSLDAARAAVLDRLAADGEVRSSTQHVRTAGAVTAGDDYVADFHAATIDALLLRAGIRVEKPHAAAGDVSASVHDIARICLSGAFASRERVGRAARPAARSSSGAR